MTKKTYIKVPTNTNGVWSYTEFPTRDSFRVFVKSCFKEPGSCGFNELSRLFNEQSKIFSKKGLYCEAPEGSRDYITYWDTEKEKCRKGVIFSDGINSWYLPRDLYFWWNFLKIADKEKKTEAFPEVWDVHYYMALYNIIAQLYDRHSAILKKRQIGSSLYHMAKLINLLWFEKSQILKMGASGKDYINNDKGSWLILDYYRDFLNKHTGWYRPMSPDKSASMSWQQRLEVKENGRTSFEGNSSKLTGTSFEKNATAGVGGPCHRLGTLICMADGSFKPVENISLGEYVLGIDNKPKKVQRLFSGVDTIYRVEQIRGEDYYTTGDHKLYLINRDKKVSEKTQLRITKTKDWEALTTYRKRCYVGVKNKKPLVFHNEYQESKQLLDPYFLGLWLGDGYRSVPGLIINRTADIEILEYMQQLSKKTKTKLHIRTKEKDRYNVDMCHAIFSIGEDGIDSYFTKGFVHYNLFYNKHIPDAFLYGTVDTRLAILAGFIDTDGYYDPNKGHFEVCCKNDRLCFQLAFLCRSLGAYVKQGLAPSQEHVVKGKTIKYTETNRLSIRFQDPSIVPTKTKRKIGTNIRNRERNIHTSPIKAITAVGIEPYAGIQVEDSLYYLHDLTITHNCRIFFHEEAGIAPKMSETFEFMRPALSMGGILTGQFIAAGSVGNLDQCKPLENMIKNPHGNSVYAVKSTLVNENEDEAETGLFIPEQWGRPPHIDQYGNSLVTEALEAIKKERHIWEHGDDITGEKPIEREKLQLRISQQPINIDEAFAIRKTSLFPSRYVKPQIQRIEDNEYKLEYVDLERNEKGEVVTVPSKRVPLVTDVSMTTPDKRACVVIHEHPIPGKVPLKTYLGSIDPVAGDKTITSESMACIYIYKMPTLRMHTTADGKKESSTEGGKIVAWWTGRYDDINETNEQLSMLVEYYQSYTTCEYNVGSWVNYMIGKRRSRYVAVKEDMIFDKEAGVTQNSMNNYGWYNTPQTWKKMLEEGINYISQALLTTYKDDGTVERVKYAVETIPDIWLLKEMQQYQPNDGRNYDRIITYCALVAFVGLRLSNMPGMYTEAITSNSDGSTDSKKLGSMDSVRIFKENTQTFRNLLGQVEDNTSYKADYSRYKKRSAFKHLK